ncbi:MAG: hypothetical protein ACREMQ_22420 [Longimicrobiales bacterium]
MLRDRNGIRLLGEIRPRCSPFVEILLVEIESDRAAPAHEVQHGADDDAPDVNGNPQPLARSAKVGRRHQLVEKLVLHRDEAKILQRYALQRAAAEFTCHLVAQRSFPEALLIAGGPGMRQAKPLELLEKWLVQRCHGDAGGPGLSDQRLNGVPDRELAVSIAGVAGLMRRLLAVVRKHEKLALVRFQVIEMVGRQYRDARACPVRNSVRVSPRE